MRIVKESDPIQVKQLVCCIYAPPGHWKTSVAFTAADPLLLAFDSGVYRARVRRDCVQVGSWTDVVSVSPSDLEPYKTIIVDTAGRALDKLAVELIARDSRLGRNGALTQQGFGALKSTFCTWVNFLATLGKDVVFLAHANEDKVGDDVVLRLDVQGGSKGEIYKTADMMGRLYLNGEGKIILDFNQSNSAYAKNPGHIQPQIVPDVREDRDFLARLIQQTKDELNRLTEEQRVKAEAMKAWEERVSGAKSTSDFDVLKEEATEVGTDLQDQAKRILLQAAKSAGFVYDKAVGQFQKRGT